MPFGLKNTMLAEVYLSTFKNLGVTISLPKSLVTGVGGAKFAKKFITCRKIKQIACKIIKQI